MRSTYVNLEIGLIELENVNDWTSQVYGLGPIGPLLDLNDHNLSLRLIGQEVVAHGAHSGELSGRIQALFYRYKSVGGYEYVSDFLIAPATGKREHSARGFRYGVAFGARNWRAIGRFRSRWNGVDSPSRFRPALND